MRPPCTALATLPRLGPGWAPCRNVCPAARDETAGLGLDRIVCMLTVLVIAHRVPTGQDGLLAGCMVMCVVKIKNK